MSHDQGWAAPGGPEQPPSAGPAPWSAGGPADDQGPSHDAGATGGTTPPAPGRGWGLPPGAGPTWSAPQRPGVVPLRPLGVFEIFEGGFRAISANPKVMLGVSAVVFGLVAVVSLLLVPVFGGALASALNDALGLSGDPDLALAPIDLVGLDPVTILVSILATTVLTGLLVLSVSGSVIGREVNGTTLWRRVRGRLLALVGLSLLTTVVLVLVAVVPVVLASVALAPVSTGAAVGGAVLGFLLGVALVVWLATRWAFAPVVLLLEQRSVLASLRRSAALVKGTWWRVLGVLLLTLVVALLASSILAGPAVAVVAVVNAVSDGEAASTELATFLGLLFSTVANVLVFPFVSAVTALLYTDLRIRQEGLDVELARAAEASS